MPTIPKNIKNKGHFIMPGHAPCKETLPRYSITEWLELEAPANYLSTIEKVDGKLYTRTKKYLNSDSSPNMVWLLKEQARCSKANSHPETMEFAIEYSKDGRFGCLCRRPKKSECGDEKDL